MSESDPIKDMHRTMNSGLARAVEMHRDLKDKLVTAPAFPISDKPDELVATKPRPRADRERDYLTTRHSPHLIAAMAAEQSARWKLPKHKPYPRSVVQFFLDGEREFGA